VNTLQSDEVLEDDEQFRYYTLCSVLWMHAWSYRLHCTQSKFGTDSLFCMAVTPQSIEFTISDNSTSICKRLEKKSSILASNMQ